MLGIVKINGRKYDVLSIRNHPNKEQFIHLVDNETGEEVIIEYIPDEMGKLGWRE